MHTLIHKIQQIQQEKGTCIVAIDGRCGSGKTTLAAILQDKLVCTVIHLDDFFLQPYQRTPLRYQTPGENVDHERFLQEVLFPLAEKRPFVYYPFDCGNMKISDQGIAVNMPSVCVIEGSYSLRPDLRSYYDLKLFLDIDPDAQLTRIALRNPDKLEMFKEKWIPLEESYFAAYEVDEQADAVITGFDNEKITYEFGRGIV